MMKKFQICEKKDDVTSPTTQTFYLPRGERNCVDCIIRMPRKLSQDSRILVAVHGISRRALQQMVMFTQIAERNNAVIVAPLFNKREWRTYQKLVCKRKSGRADLALIESLKQVYSLLGIQENKLLLYGYSGGGQFVHRFAMLHPEKVEAVALGAAGWYTLPDTLLPFPLGLAESTKGGTKISVDPVLFTGVKFLVSVGENDTAVDRSLNQNADIIERQGGNRIERAQNWVKEMNEYIGTLKESGGVELSIIPGVSHSFRQCMNDENYVASLEKFFFTG